MQAAKAKYEETRESVVAVMTDMNDSQVRSEMIDVQLRPPWQSLASIDATCCVLLWTGRGCAKLESLLRCTSGVSSQDARDLGGSP